MLLAFSGCEKVLKDLWDNLQWFKALTTQQKNAIISTFNGEELILDWELIHPYTCESKYEAWSFVKGETYEVRNDYHTILIDDPKYWEFSGIVKIEIRKDKNNTGISIANLLKKISWKGWPYINSVKIKLLDWYDWGEEYTICRDEFISYFTTTFSKK